MKKKIVIVVPLILIALTLLVFAQQELMAKIVNFDIYVNSEQKQFENPIVVIDGRTYIPLREVAETLGMDVEWNESDRSISISNDGAGNNDLAEYGALYPFEYNKRWGYKDINGNVIVEPIYVYVYDFTEGLGCIRNIEEGIDAYGFIDTTGAVVIPCIYTTAYPFNDGAALVSLAQNTAEGRWTYIDHDGNYLFDKEFEGAMDFYYGYAPVIKEGIWKPGVPTIWSYINKRGEFVNDLEFEEAEEFYNGYARVKNNGKYGIIDLNFNLIVPYEYDNFIKYEDGVLYESQGNGWVVVKANVD